jgi:4-hydroxybenzoate polyprenyltransferase
VNAKANQRKACNPSQLSQTSTLAVSVAVFATTLHCQDFKDVDGDRLAGRRTLPMAFPIASRISVGLGIPFWSMCLCCIWDLDWLCTVAFVAYGCLVGARFMLYQTVEADRQSCKYYSVSAIPLQSITYSSA